MKPKPDLEPTPRRDAATVRRTLESALLRWKTPTQAGAALGVTEGAIRKWLKRGNLNSTPAPYVLKLSELTGIPPEHFLVDDGD
jgi:hypothetical protein